MRSSRITWLGTKSDDKCPCKREAEGELQGPKRRQRGLEGGRGSGDEAAGAGRPAAERQALRGAGMGGRGHAAAPARLPTSGFGLGNDSALGVSDLPLL